MEFLIVFIVFYWHLLGPKALGVDLEYPKESQKTIIILY